MTAPLKWRSQLCPCGYCPDGTRIEWRYTLDIRFRPRDRTHVRGSRLLTEEKGGRTMTREGER